MRHWSLAVKPRLLTLTTCALPCTATPKEASLFCRLHYQAVKHTRNVPTGVQLHKFCRGCAVSATPQVGKWEVDQQKSYWPINIFFLTPQFCQVGPVFKNVVIFLTKLFMFTAQAQLPRYSMLTRELLVVDLPQGLSQVFSNPSKTRWWLYNSRQERSHAVH